MCICGEELCGGINGGRRLLADSFSAAHMLEYSWLASRQSAQGAPRLGPRPSALERPQKWEMSPKCKRLKGVAAATERTGTSSTLHESSLLGSCLGGEDGKEIGLLQERKCVFQGGGEPLSAGIS